MTAGSAELGWPQDVRLRKSRDFRRVQGRGRKVRRAHVLVLYFPGHGAVSRFGITVSRKVGGAVTRNRVKRWLREALRHERAALSGLWDVVVIAHPSASSAGHEALRQDVAGALAVVSRDGGDRARTGRDRRRR